MFHPRPGWELEGRVRAPIPGLPGGGRRQGGLNQAGLGASPGPCGFIIAGERSQKSLAGALGDEVSTTRPTKPPATSLIALGPSCLIPPVQLSPDQSSQSRQRRGQGRVEVCHAGEPEGLHTVLTLALINRINVGSHRGSPNLSFHICN